MFYICPPKGRVALHTLENCVFARFEYLNLLETNDTDSFTGNFEYLLENSICDSIGHFVLRLIAATSSDLWLQWLKKETLLLKHRLNHLTVRQIHRLFRNIIKQVKKHSCIETSVAKALMDISTHFLKPHVFNHTIKEKHTEDCRKYQCTVSFVSVPDLVRKRKVDLHYGYATVFCSEWKHVLVSLFNTFVANDKKRLISSSGHLVTLDPRLSSISQRIHSRASDAQRREGSITSKNIDAESKKFPPCMQHLHSILRDKHRLSHHARFHYSLFLKECGMKLEDAIDYWKQEYSKPHACQSSCTHSWQTNERKFLYSIRHCYGLEGGRKNYKTPNCEMICTETPGLRYEGGCPFKHFDANTLETFMKRSIDKSEVKESLNIVAMQSPQSACTSFLKSVHKREGEGPIYSPVQYYTRVNK